MNGSSYSTVNGRLQQNGPSNLVLVLEPINDTFVMKSLELLDQTKVKIGRQTGVTTAPHPSNGFFDSKVLSRVHAEVWSESGKVFIRDLKSSNGTFLNGKRLCAENTESEPFELGQGDNLEFGIDILDENGALLHEKVSCKICLSRKNMAASGTTTQDSIAKQKLASTSGSGVYSTKTNSTATAASAAAAAAAVAAPGGLSENIDLILSRLQNELTRSQETYTDLGFLKHGLHELEKVFVVTTTTPGTNIATSTPTAVPEEMKDESSSPKLNGGSQTAATATTSSSPLSSPPQGSHPPFQIATGSTIEFDRSQQEHAHTQEISRLTIALGEMTAELGSSKERIQALERQLDEERQVFEEEQQNHFQQQLEADRTRERLDQLTAEFDQISERHQVELEAALTELETTHKENVGRLILEADQEHAALVEDFRSTHAEEMEQLESLRLAETTALEEELREIKEQLQGLQEEPQQQQQQRHQKQESQQQQKQAHEQEQQDLLTSRTENDSLPESSKELMAQVAAVREELAKAHREIQELRKDRQGRRLHLQEEDYGNRNGNRNGNGHSSSNGNGNGNGNGSLETLMPNSTIFEDGQDTAISKPIFPDTTSETAGATATAAAMALAQEAGRGDYTRRDFSWSQFAFPMDKRNQTCINHPSTMLLSGVFLLVGVGVYALWHRAGMPGY